MLSVNTFRLLRGYVRFRAAGGFYERFVNLCAVRQVGLWDVRVDECGVIACIAAKDYRKLREIAHTSGSSLSVIERRGLPFFLHKRRDRIGALIGMVIFTVFMGLMSTMVWRIEVVGCERLDEETVIELFEELGVKVGVRKATIDMSLAEKEAQIRLSDDIYWASLNIEGSSAEIEIREYPPTQRYADFGSPCNVVAGFDGIIVEMSVTGGTAATKIGNGVRKGDLLISGVIENKDLSTSMYEASGTVIGRHTKIVSGEASSDLSVKKYVGARQSLRLQLFGLKIPLGLRSKQESDSFDDTSSFKAGEVILPVGVTKVTNAVYNIQNAQLSDKQTRLIAVSNYVNMARINLAASIVLEDIIRVEQGKGRCMVINEADCLDLIGVQQAILTEES